MTFAKGTAGKTSITPTELGSLLHSAIEAVLKRGGAHLGDKTVVDSLAAIAKTLTGTNDVNAVANARSAAQAALDQFRDEPNKVGRAGRYGNKSRGLDDPGMLAVALFCDSL